MADAVVFDTGKGDPSRPIALGALAVGIVLAVGVGAPVLAKASVIAAIVVALALLSIGLLTQRVARSAFAREAVRVAVTPAAVDLEIAGRTRSVPLADVRRLGVVHVVTRDRDTGRETRVTKLRTDLKDGTHVETLTGPSAPSLGADLRAVVGGAVEVHEDERVFGVGDTARGG